MLLEHISDFELVYILLLNCRCMQRMMTVMTVMMMLMMLMMLHCHLQTESVHHTSSDVYHLVSVFQEVGFVTQTVIAQTAVTSVVSAFHHCCLSTKILRNRKMLSLTCCEMRM